MQMMPLEQAEGRLGEIIDQLPPGAEVVLTRDDRPVATLRIAPRERPRPGPGLCKGMITIVSDDDEHLKDFEDYMP